MHSAIETTFSLTPYRSRIGAENAFSMVSRCVARSDSEEVKMELICPSGMGRSSSNKARAIKKMDDG